MGRREAHSHSMNMERVRQFVDGELPASLAAEFERAMALDPALRDQVTFERSLRQRVARQMLESAPAAPAALCSAVRESIALGPPRPVPATEAEPSGLARFFAGPTRANFFAVAACLLIVAGSVVVGMFGDEWGFGIRGPARQSSSDIRLDAMAGTAQEAGLEHDRCMSAPGAIALTLRYRNPDEIQTNLHGVLGTTVPVFNLSAAGLTLMGGGECALEPLPSSTVHLMYTDNAGRGGLSIFLQPNRGQFGELENVLLTGRMYLPADLGCAGEPACMLTDGRLIYIIRACDRTVQEAGTNAILRALASGN